MSKNTLSCGDSVMLYRHFQLLMYKNLQSNPAEQLLGSMHCGHTLLSKQYMYMLLIEYNDLTYFNVIIGYQPKAGYCNGKIEYCNFACLEHNGKSHILKCNVQLHANQNTGNDLQHILSIFIYTAYFSGQPTRRYVQITENAILHRILDYVSIMIYSQQVLYSKYATSAVLHGYIFSFA